MSRLLNRRGTLLLLMLWSVILPAFDTSDIEDAHKTLYKKFSPAVVGVSGGGQKGSGVIVSAKGLVLTSYWAVRGAKQAYVILNTHQRIKGKVVATDEKKEMALIQIDAREGQTFPFVELGDSDAVKIGQITYVLGDSFNSIFSDGQVAMSLGTLTGISEITEIRYKDAAYTGTVLETSSAVNANQNGAPLLDARGRLIGMVTLNFDTSRFTGLALPINVLKPSIRKAAEETVQKKGH